MTNKKTLILGATDKPDRYAYLAAEKLLAHRYEIIPVGVRKAEVLGHPIIRNKDIQEGVHTVTLYINPTRQKEWEDYILDTQPERVIFNPGTENEALKVRLQKADIEVVEGCTLVMLSNSSY